MVSISDIDEFYKITHLAEASEIKVLWVGARRNATERWPAVKWVTGESMTFTRWYPGEPTYTDTDGTVEDMLALHRINDVWYYNDTPNDVTKYYSGRIGYIIESD